jgi:hypothetical protein
MEEEPAAKRAKTAPDTEGQPPVLILDLDGDFAVPLAVGCPLLVESGTIQNFLGDIGEITSATTATPRLAVPCDAQTLAQIMGYTERRHAAVGPPTDAALRSFVFSDDRGLSLGELQSIIQAGNFLAAEQLIESACQVAAMAVDNLATLTLEDLVLAHFAQIGQSGGSAEEEDSSDDNRGVNAEASATAVSAYSFFEALHGHEPKLARNVLMLYKSQHGKPRDSHFELYWNHGP